MALLSYPLMLGIGAVAPNFTALFFDNGWDGIELLIQIFCLASLTEVLLTFPNSILLSQGASGQLFKLSVWTKVFNIFGIAIGTAFGIVGVALGYSITSIINFFILFYFSGQKINLRIGVVIRQVAPFAFIAGLMALVVGIVLPAVPQFAQWAVLVRLLIQVLVGGAIYVGLLLLFQPHPTREILNIISAKFHAR